MKTLPTIAAVTIAVALLLVPMASSAAGSITFTSPAAGASYSGSQAYTIAGTISPTPTQVDNVGITVKNPSGQTVDVGNVPVSSGGFSYSTAVGGPSGWVTGTYTISAQDSYGASGTATFTYTAPAPSAGYNVTRALVNIQGNLTIIQKELVALQSAGAKEQVDMKANFTAITGQLTTLSNNLATLTTNVGTIQTDVTNMQGQLTTMASNIATLTSAVQSAQAAAQAAQTAANNANSAVSSTQTYVLVVAVLAAITLVLELAILVRKLS